MQLFVSDLSGMGQYEKTNIHLIEQLNGGFGQVPSLAARITVETLYNTVNSC